VNNKERFFSMKTLYNFFVSSTMRSNYIYVTHATRRLLGDVWEMNESLFSFGANVYTKRGTNAG
jgi:hypothetical protein